MAKKPRKSNKEWSDADEKKLKDLARKNTPTGLVAWQLGRSKDSIYSKASDMGISLKPTNKSPYNRKRNN